MKGSKGMLKKPKPLSKGDKVAIVSLSSGMLGEEFARHELEIGIHRFKELGLTPVFMPHALKGIEYLNTHPEARAEDLKTAFYDPTINGIICAIGGNDTYKLLPYLMEDQDFINAVHNHPKLFTGFSDTTVNHLMFYKLGMATFYGPNFVCDLAEFDDEMLPYTKSEFLKYFQNPSRSCIQPSVLWYEERTDFSSDAVGTSRIIHLEEHGYEVLQGKGKIQGTLLGGCLESLCDLLPAIGEKEKQEIIEKYKPFPSLEEWKGKILFLETSEEKPDPIQFEKYLNLLKSTGIFHVIQGILVGKPQDEEYYEEYKEIYLKVIENKNLPILYNINFGHGYPRCVIPYGIETEVDVDKKTITFLESFFI